MKIWYSIARFSFLSIVLRPPIVLVLELVLVLGFSWVGAKISKIENPSAALAIPTWPHRDCKPQEQRINTTS
jgi:hypothetical protein